MKNKKKITIAGITIASAALVTLSAISVSKVIKLSIKANELPNQINFSLEKNMPDFSATSKSFTSEIGNNFKFAYEGVTEWKNGDGEPLGWGTIATDGFIANKNEGDKDKILNDLSSLKLTTSNTATAKVRMYYARNEQLYSDLYSRDFVINAGNDVVTTLTFDGHPGFFKMKVTEGSLNVKSMELNYGCDSSVTEEWDEKLGSKPSLCVSSGTETIINYGAYPTFRIEYDENPDSLYQQIKTASNNYTTGQFIYCPNELEFTKLYGAQYFLYHTTVDGEPVFYSVSLIPWRYVADSGENKVFDCSFILDYQKYENDESITDGHVFNESSLRKWLTPVKGDDNSGTFAKIAFALDRSNLVPISTVDTLKSEVVGKSAVYVPTKNDLNSWYGTSAKFPSESRKKLMTTYVKETKIKTTEDNYWEYWTRTQFGIATSTINYVCGKDGVISEDSTKAKSQCSEQGISPAITLTGIQF